MIERVIAPLSCWVGLDYICYDIKIKNTCVVSWSDLTIDSICDTGYRCVIS